MTSICKRVKCTKIRRLNDYKLFPFNCICVGYSSSNPPVPEQTIDQKFKLPRLHNRRKNNLWADYANLAVKYKPIDLGMGFPDGAVPMQVRQALIQVANNPDPLLHQYTRGYGHPRLVKVLAELYSKEFNRKIDPFNEILIAVGAYHALYCAIVGLVDVDDEVIIIEPFFDCYESIVLSVGAKPVYIPLRKQGSCDGYESSANYTLDTEEFSKLFNSKTKLIILNNPHNPCGKVFTKGELTIIADLCTKWNVVCISDEVFDFIVFKPYKMCRIGTLPGMWERTITISTAGKLFSITGWKTGYALGPANLMKNLQAIHSKTILFYNTPIQEALAIILENEMQRYGREDSYLVTFSAKLEKKRTFLSKCLQEVGMKVILPQAGYFIVADYTTLKHEVDLSCEKIEWKDFRFTKWLARSIGILGIPLSPFYSYKHRSKFQNYVRFCHFKKDETLLRAQKVLREWKIKDRCS